jgi:hypothetical protein
MEVGPLVLGNQAAALLAQLVLLCASRGGTQVQMHRTLLHRLLMSGYLSDELAHIFGSQRSVVLF